MEISVSSDSANTFIQRIKGLISDKPEKSSDSSEILVCEVDDEASLDERDQQMIATLRAAHEKSEKRLNDKQPDSYKSVRMKIQ